MARVTTAQITDLFDRHFDAVYAYVAYRLAPRQDGVADVSQEVFAAALDGLPGIRDRQATRSWLLAIARNKVADHYRSRTRAMRTLAVDAGLPDRPDTGESVPGLVRREQSLLVARVLSELADRQRELLEDKYIREMTVRAIAQANGTTEKAVESALARARRSFLEAMSVHEREPESTR